jgi:hypothetical protein
MIDYCMQPPQPISLRKLVLLGALQLSAIWDLVTTFLGLLLILDSLNLVTISLAMIGTLIVVAFSFATRAIWQRRQHFSAAGLPLVLMRLVWLMAIALDLGTSLTCNAWFVANRPRGSSVALADLLGQLSLGQLVIVVFVTLVTGISPILMGYLRGRDLDAWLG